jgi:hypothetical protein
MMKDLLVYVADADALAFLRALLNRPQALGIRAVTFDIERHPQRDAGVVQSGAELTRMQKGRYQKALLICDHHGCGRDHRQSAREVEREIQGKLDSFTWENNSAVSVLVPELEEWLWSSRQALASHCGVTAGELSQWIEERARRVRRSVEELQTQQPKELFEHVMRDRIRRTISPRDFEEIGRHASVGSLQSCASFRSVADTLRTWFPS